MHLFVDISSHGFGHLALSAPVLNALHRRSREAGRELRLTLRTALPEGKLRERIHAPFDLIAEASDFGFFMKDAVRVDLPASAQAYQRAHQNWEARVAAEARRLAGLAPDGVFSNVSCLPLAGAAAAGIPSVALCSLNWADLFGHFFGGEAWAGPIHEQLLAAYRAADIFLRPEPAMDMPHFPRQQSLAPIAAMGTKRSLPVSGKRVVLVAMGGIAHRLPLEAWPEWPDTCWLVPGDWHCTRPDALPLESLGLPFSDLLASVDAVITKPGYGTFAEAAAVGTPVLYQRREDWPEQECLIEWLQREARAMEIPAERLLDGHFREALEALVGRPAKAAICPNGAEEAARVIDRLLGG